MVIMTDQQAQQLARAIHSIARAIEHKNQAEPVTKADLDEAVQEILSAIGDSSSQLDPKLAADLKQSTDSLAEAVAKQQ